MAEADGNFYKTLLDNLYDGVYFVGPDRKITYWNKGAESLTGYKSSEMVGKYCWNNILMHINPKGRNLCKGLCPLAKAMKEGAMTEQEVYLRHKDGHRAPVLVRASPIKDAKGQVVGAVEIFSDNSPRITLKQKVEELQQLALLDPLTGLGNRRYAESTIYAKLDEFRRYGWIFGLFFIDIDNFKKINDTHGHKTGDKVLQMVAKTLQNGVRVSDVVSRWGGEEFIAVIAHIDKKRLESLSNKLLALVSQSTFSSGEESVNVTISIGATIARVDDTPEDLISRADNLMYRGKQSGRNCVVMD